MTNFILIDSPLEQIHNQDARRVFPGAISHHQPLQQPMHFPPQQQPQHLPQHSQGQVMFNMNPSQQPQIRPNSAATSPQVNPSLNVYQTTSTTKALVAPTNCVQTISSVPRNYHQQPTINASGHQELIPGIGPNNIDLGMAR